MMFFFPFHAELTSTMGPGSRNLRTLETGKSFFIKFFISLTAFRIGDIGYSSIGLVRKTFRIVAEWKKLLQSKVLNELCSVNLVLTRAARSEIEIVLMSMAVMATAFQCGVGVFLLVLHNIFSWSLSVMFHRHVVKKNVIHWERDSEGWTERLVFFLRECWQGFHLFQGVVGLAGVKGRTEIVFWVAERNTCYSGVGRKELVRWVHSQKDPIALITYL